MRGTLNRLKSISPENKKYSKRVLNKFINKILNYILIYEELICI